MSRPAKKRYGDGVREKRPGVQEMRYRLPDGKERTKLYYGTYSQAVKARPEWIRELTGVAPTGHSLTIAEAWTLYMAKFSAMQHRSKTQLNYAKQWEADIKCDPLGAVKLVQHHQRDVEAWELRLLARGNSRSTIETKRKNLNAVINWCVRQELVASNKVALAERLTELDTRVEPKTIFDVDEIPAFLDRCERDEPWGPWAQFSLLTGARPGEVLAVHLDDIDWTADRVFFDSAVQRDRKHHAIGLGPTKTSQWRWHGFIDERVGHAVKRQIEYNESMGNRYLDPMWNGLIFTHDGKPPRDQTALKALKALCRRAGVKELTPYELRHTFASHLLKQREQPLVVAELMGTSIKRLYQNYAQLMPDDTVRATVRMW